MFKLPEVYWEDPDHVYKNIPLSDEEYARASPRFPKIASDTIIIDRSSERIYLAKRIVYALKGWWNFGGSLLPREDLIVGAHRTFQRDAGLVLKPERFEQVMCQRIISATREEIPQDAGEDAFVFQFAVELTARERSHVRVHPKRYDASLGLRAFDRDALVRETPLPLVKFYDEMFG